MRSARKVLLTIFILAMALCLPTAVQADYAYQDGHKVFYQVMGKGSPALVFIHGWSSDHTFWQNQAPELAKQFKVVLMDLPGHGKSDAPRLAYTQPYLAGGVRAVMDAAGVKQAVLIGHSMGLSVARVLAMAHPDRAAGIFNLDGAVFMPPTEPKALAKWQKDLAAWVAPLKGPDSRQAKLAFVRAMFTPETPAKARKQVEEVFLATPWWVAGSSMANFQDLAVWRVPPLKVPMMSLYAYNEHRPPDFPAYLKKLFPETGYVVWKGPGHFIMFDRPMEVTVEIRKFAEGLL